MMAPSPMDLIFHLVLSGISCLALPIIIFAVIAMATTRRKSREPPPAVRLVNCPNCNRALAQMAERCPACGCEFGKQSQSQDLVDGPPISNG